MVDIDYEEIFVPTTRRKSLCIFLAIFIALGLIIHLVNIIGTYLKSHKDNNKFLIFKKPLLKMYKL